MRCETLHTHTPELFEIAARKAADVLKTGQVVGLPTETVYGLAGNAFDPSAVQRIYDVKGRPSHNPIIVHVDSLEMARQCVSDWPETAQTLAAAFWPGPLTLVLPKSDRVPDIVTAGGSTVGIRWPGHPLMQTVIRYCGFPLAAPSANPANQLSPTNAGHVLQGLGDKIPLIVDGGQSQVGIESTVVDLTVTPVRVLRPGIISTESLAAALNSPVQSAGTAGEGQSLRSPGMLKKHYSPRAKLVICDWRSEVSLVETLRTYPIPRHSIHIIAHTHIPMSGEFGRVSVIPHDAEAFARAIYAELHHCDAEKAQLIVVEALPEGPAWQGIADRLNRAAS
ncbi:MAG TPA: L-threonylcarbamoyladenylate synthase [Roseimicrobium sp.]|nr:L-threonylcarbamoyladenylate synthase [Roseimicrobium sp.]